MKCSVINCGLCQSKNRPNLTFHRLPRNESRKREWLENIGLENIRPKIYRYVCSLHFAESAFNKTLTVLRLKDDAVPTVFTKTEQPCQPVLENSCPSAKNIMDAPQSSTSFHQQPINQTILPNNVELMAALEDLKKLEEKVLEQKKKIKCLNETVRVQKKKIENFKNIIIRLKKENLINNDVAILLQQCTGSKDFLHRQILKMKGLPLPKHQKR